MVPQDLAKKYVLEYVHCNADKYSYVNMTDRDVYIVWFAITLQSWKALLATNLGGNTYYDLAYDSDSDKLDMWVFRTVDEISYAHVNHREELN